MLSTAEWCKYGELYLLTNRQTDKQMDIAIA